MEESLEKDAHHVFIFYFALILLKFSSVSQPFSLYGTLQAEKIVAEPSQNRTPLTERLF
jgi:hypothetical protein